jgi:hypothetical protein
MLGSFASVPAGSWLSHTTTKAPFASIATDGSSGACVVSLSTRNSAPTADPLDS